MSEQRILPNRTWSDAVVPGARESRSEASRGQRTAEFVDHDARTRLFDADAVSQGWESRLIRRVIFADLVAFVAAEMIAAMLMAGRINEVLTMFGHHVSYLALAIAGLPAWLGVLALNHAYDRSLIGSSPDEYRNVMRADDRTQEKTTG